MNWERMLFQGWHGVARTVVVGLLAYATLILFLRISGKRTLAKLNAFDLVVTVALGSTLSAMLLQDSVALAQGATALALLILMQFVVTFFSVRSEKFARAIRLEPTALLKDGQLFHQAMRAERVTAGEILSAIRAAGGHRLADGDTVTLESDGTLSVSLRNYEEASSH